MRNVTPLELNIIASFKIIKAVVLLFARNDERM